MTNAADYDPLLLPDHLPVPFDDGAAAHLVGLSLPGVILEATNGERFDMATLPGRNVIYVYPRTGRPGEPPPEGWDAVPGARGCTPQSCAFKDHHAELIALSVSQVFGLSTQNTIYQREAHTRLHLPFLLLSDNKYAFTSALNLPTFTIEGMKLLKRLTMIVESGVISKIFYPVFPPDKNASEVAGWLRQTRANNDA